MNVRKLTFLLVAAAGLLLVACGGAGEPEATAEVVPLEVNSATAGNVTIYRISSDESQVRFELDEVLRGQDKTVVGSTDQVAGEIALDPADLSTAQVGTITVSAAGLETDNGFRNRAIQNFILQTGQFPEITFSPAAVDGLPESAQAGDTVNFTVSGDLAIRDQSRAVTFNVTATLESNDRLVGTASTSVARADFGLQIPNAPGVANVEETVELFIDFVATAVS